MTPHYDVMAGTLISISDKEFACSNVTSGSRLHLDSGAEPVVELYESLVGMQCLLRFGYDVVAPVRAAFTRRRIHSV